MLTKRFALAVLLALLLAFVAVDTIGAVEPAFKVGAARRDITPTEPVPMWGYGARHAMLSEGVLDPLQATAVVIEAGDQKFAIVGLDLGRSPSERSLQNIRERIKSQAGIEYSFISGSHTHHGPVLELTDREGFGKGKFDAAIRYYHKLEDEIVAAIVEADSSRVVAKIANGSIQLDGFNRNRHTKFTPVPLDRTLGLLKFDSAATGETIATIVNFTGHPTNVPGEILKFSSDYIGPMTSVVEKELGGKTVFMQGASGDVSVNRGDRGDYKGYGEALGKEVAKLAKSLNAEPVPNASLAIKEDRFRFDSRTDLNNPFIRTAYSVAFFPELVSNFVEEYADGIRPRITVALLNDKIAFVGGSGEFFCQHAIRLRERARVEQLFFFGYCNGYHQYFPTIEAAAEGGYGADSQVAPAYVGSGEFLMNKALVWIYEMQGKLN